MRNLLVSPLLRFFPSKLGKGDNILGSRIPDEGILRQKTVPVKARTTTIFVKMDRRTTSGACLMLYTGELLVIKPICIQRRLFLTPLRKVSILACGAPLCVKGAITPARPAIPNGRKRRDRLPLKLARRFPRSFQMRGIRESRHKLCRVIDNLGDALSGLPGFRGYPITYILEADR